MKSVSVLLALSIVGAASAQASDFGSKSSVVLFAGGNAAMPGSFRGQTVPLEITDPDGSVVYNDLKFEDAYNDRYSVGAEYDYALRPNLDLFGRYAYQAFNGQEITVGSFSSPALDTTQPVAARFSDTHTQELDVGARYDFAPMHGIRPFVGLALGAEKLAPTRAGFLNVAGPGTITNVVLGESDTVFQQRVETGLQFSPGEKFDVRLSVAANHVDADTRSSDPDLALVGLDNTQADVRSHWEYPVELGGVWKF
jgi:hypothetical protein